MGEKVSKKELQELVLNPVLGLHPTGLGMLRKSSDQIILRQEAIS
jgi:hypothetical protein